MHARRGSSRGGPRPRRQGKRDTTAAHPAAARETTGVKAPRPGMVSAAGEEDAVRSGLCLQAPENQKPPHPAGAAYHKAGRSHPPDGVRTKWTGTRCGQARGFAQQRWDASLTASTLRLAGKTPAQPVG